MLLCTQHIVVSSNSKGISALNLQVKQTVCDVQLLLLHHMQVCNILFWSVAYVAVADVLCPSVNAENPTSTKRNTISTIFPMVHFG